MRYQIPIPKDWQSFEELCLRLWRDIWGDPNAQKNGRIGQEQNGVDIFGVATYDGKTHGVQCKGKNANYGAQLTEDEIRTEADNAEGFNAVLSTFTMATTAPRDAKLQAYCRELNETKAHDFTVAVWSWDDIEEEIQYRTEILDHLRIPYDDSEIESPSLKMSILTGKDRLFAFLTRPIIKAVTSPSVRVLLHNVLYEIIQNAFLHGHATQCMLLYKDYCFTIIDNGSQFDPRSLIEEEGRGGAMTLKDLLNVCKEGVYLSHDSIQEEGQEKNIFKLSFMAETLCREIHNTVEFFITNSFCVQSRKEAIQQAVADMSKLSEQQSALVMFADIVPISGIIAYVDKAVRLVGPDRLNVSLPKAKEQFSEHLKMITPNVSIR